METWWTDEELQFDEVIKDFVIDDENSNLPIHTRWRFPI